MSCSISALILLFSHSQACAPRPLPALLPLQPLLHPRLQREPGSLQQRRFAEQKQPTSSRNRGQTTWARLKPEQPNRTPRLTDQRHARQRRPEHVSEISFGLIMSYFLELSGFTILSNQKKPLKYPLALSFQPISHDEHFVHTTKYKSTFSIFFLF